MSEPYFLKAIQKLRDDEEIVLYNNLMEINPEEVNLTAEYLHKEYENESDEYPGIAPHFDLKAAIWAGKIVYNTAQLIVYRKHEIEELENMFPMYNQEIDASTWLSADLCLRFLPDLIQQLTMIDDEDELIPLLENILKEFHYSGISSEIKFDNLDFSILETNRCLKQLYTNRIIEYKNITLTEIPEIRSCIKASLGDYSSVFWNEFETKTTNE